MTEDFLTKLRSKLAETPRYELMMEGTVQETKSGRFYRVQDIDALVAKIHSEAVQGSLFIQPDKVCCSGTHVPVRNPSGS